MGEKTLQPQPQRYPVVTNLCCILFIHSVTKQIYLYVECAFLMIQFREKRLSQTFAILHILFSFCSTKDQTQGLTYARQVPYH
jgi:hypothetical protein